jgi:hypothetical protein
MVRIEVDAKAALAAVQKFARDVAIANAVALTKVAKRGEQEVKEEMRRVLDRPTPFALRAVKSSAATKEALESTVYLEGQDRLGGNVDYSPAALIGPQFLGGRRVVKRLERYFISAGLLAAGEYLVPGAAARLDKYGNLSRGQINQIIAQLRVGLDPASFRSGSARSRRNVRRAGRIFWSRGTRALPRGAYVDQGAPIGVRPLLAVVRTPSYRPRINMEAVVFRTLRREYRSLYEEALRKRGRL